LQSFIAAKRGTLGPPKGHGYKTIRVEREDEGEVIRIAHTSGTMKRPGEQRKFHSEYRMGARNENDPHLLGGGVPGGAPKKILTKGDGRPYPRI